MRSRAFAREFFAPAVDARLRARLRECQRVRDDYALLPPLSAPTLDIFQSCSLLSILPPCLMPTLPMTLLMIRLTPPLCLRHACYDAV